MNKTTQPWYQSWHNAIRRCNDPKNNRYQYYGAKGIRFEMTFWEMGYVYLRDKASQMKHPQIHRVDAQRNYTVDNCCFVESTAHSEITHRGAKRSTESRKRMSLAGGTRWGEAHGRTKLSDRQVRAVYLHLTVYPRDGATLARGLGVSTSLISAIRNKKRRTRCL